MGDCKGVDEERSPPPRKQEGELCGDTHASDAEDSGCHAGDPPVDEDDDDEELAWQDVDDEDDDDQEGEVDETVDDDDDDDAPDSNTAEKDRILLKFLREVVKPEVIAALKEGSKISLADFESYQKLEAVRNSKYWIYDEKLPRLARLKKRHEWESPSYDDLFLQNTKIQNEEIAWGGIVFLWMALYAPHIRTGLDRLNRCKTTDNFKSFKMTYREVRSSVFLRDTTFASVYGLSDNGRDTYIGFTIPAGRRRENGHRRLPVNRRCFRRRRLTSWRKWHRYAVWQTPAHVGHNMERPAIMLIEHGFITLTDATAKANLNVNSFDRAKHRYICNVARLDRWFKAVCDDVYPEQPDGTRKPSGVLVNEIYFKQHEARFKAITGLCAGTLEGILGGRNGWAWRTRVLAKQYGLPGAVFPSGKLPIGLLPRKAEREAARMARREQAAGRGEEYQILLAQQKLDREGKIRTKTYTGDLRTGRLTNDGDNWVSRLGLPGLAPVPPSGGTSAANGASYDAVIPSVSAEASGDDADVPPSRQKRPRLSPPNREEVVSSAGAASSSAGLVQPPPLAAADANALPTAGMVGGRRAPLVKRRTAKKKGAT